MKYFLILNPNSRGGKGARKFGMIFSKMENAGADFKYAYATTYPAIKQLSTEANRSGYDVIVAIGGDGTINAVLNGFYDSEGKHISDAAMAVLYTGTSPDFCKSYGIPLDMEAAVDVLIKHEIRKIRTMRISFRSGPERSEEIRYYACCANIGLGANVARDANKLRKRTGDLIGTLVSLLKAIATYKSREIRFTLDGVENRFTKIINISVGRTKYIASGIKVSEGIADDDGRCYFLVAKSPSLAGLPSMLSQAYSGNISAEGDLSMLYGSHAVFSSDSETEVEFDGDPAGYLPCELSLAGDALGLITAG